MVLDLNVLGLRVQNWIFSEIYSTGIVTFHRNVIKVDAIILKLNFNPDGLGTAAASSYIFCLGSGKSNTSLLFGVP